MLSEIVWVGPDIEAIALPQSVPWLAVVLRPEPTGARPMAKQPISDADMAAIDLAVTAEHCGVTVAQLASGDSEETIAMAEQLQEVLADIRHRLHRRAIADGELA